ncbi:MAG: SDR family NAD(P)-dependent oxidoreductase [Myxococcota bacterium]
MSFEGKHVVVTGGTRGIGAAISTAFLRAGANVSAVFARNEERAHAFAEGQGERLGVHQLDVSDGAAVEAWFEALEPPPSILVNNAGIRRDAVLGAMADQDWRSVLAVNLDGSFNCSKHALRRMSRARWGRIINIISPSGRIGLAGQANYAASKAGQEAMAKSLSKEAAKRNITVNCVSPGFIDTELLADLDESKKAELLATVPLKRFGTVEEIAAAVLFLASDQAAYITGTTLEVSGGL